MWIEADGSKRLPPRHTPRMSRSYLRITQNRVSWAHPVRKASQTSRIPTELFARTGNMSGIVTPELALGKALLQNT